MSDEKAPADIIRKLRAMVDELGEVETAEKLKISRQTIARALAGLNIQQGTQALLREKLG